MQFSALVRDIELYLHIEGSEANYMIKRFVNEAIIEFARMYDWTRLRAMDTISLDGSDNYLLDVTNLSSRFEREIALTTTSGQVLENAIGFTEYRKYQYENYSRLASKTGSWAIFGTKLYVTGSEGSADFFYISPGDFTNFPLALDVAEVPATLYYPYIIEQLAIVRFLKYMGDVEPAAAEERELIKKIQLLKSSEKRGEHSGKLHAIVRS